MRSTSLAPIASPELQTGDGQLPLATARRNRPGAASRLSAFLRRQYLRGANIPSELAVRMMNRPGSAELHRPYSQAPGVVSGPDAAIVAALRQDGIHVTSLDALGIPGTAPMRRAMDQLAHALAERSGRRPWQQVMSAAGDDLLSHASLLRWATHDRLLDIAEAYFGCPAAYDGPNFFHSVANGRESGARVWHRDREDLSTLKIAIYATDVTPESGPFEILHPAAQRLIDNCPERWRYAVLRQTELEREVPDLPAALRSITGPAGTVLFMDTGRLHHRGRPPVTRDRTAIFHSYFPRRPRHPFCCERSPLTRAQIASFAATLPPRQRDALLWRDTIRPPLRWIPPNRSKD